MISEASLWSYGVARGHSWKKEQSETLGGNIASEMPGSNVYCGCTGKWAKQKQDRMGIGSHGHRVPDLRHIPKKNGYPRILFWECHGLSSVLGVSVQFRQEGLQGKTTQKQRSH